LDDEESDDMRVEMKVSPQARKKNPNLPETWQVRAVTYQVQGKPKTVFTSLPREQYVFIDKRPKPNRPRAVKISKTRYPVNHKAAPLK
ncbi:IS4 family transposase, partial [Shewanella algae]|nr:IS4 family transposase [Shewanella algae]